MSPAPDHSLDALADRCRRAFAERFGRGPAWLIAAPGRVNLIGEHTDYNGGFVLPIAIDRWCVAAAAPSTTGESVVRSSSLGEEAAVSLSRLAAAGPAGAGALPPWARYPVGAMLEQAAALGVTDVSECLVVLESTVPVGSGLSSSAAVETACALIGEASSGRTSPPVDRALACQRAEHRWAGVPCGLMDQLASGCGREGSALLIDCRDNTLRPIPLPAEAEVVVIDTGVRHALADGEYAARRRACESACDALGVASLREIGSPGEIDGSRLSAEQARCARHVIGENGRVLGVVRALGEGRLREVGELMRASHASLRDDYRVSCAELDTLAEIAGAEPGVFGVRMTGGGFGGCVVLLAEPGFVERSGRAVRGAYARRTGRDASVHAVRAVEGAGLLRA